ncbi:MAG: RHS repeat-associated core domain-containing protein [Kiritimatiellia bacterium]
MATDMHGARMMTATAADPLADIFAFRFSTKYYDAETGLYYYGYRFYAPELMRWLNRDPIGERGGNNLYTYARNSPTCLTDPLGLTPTLNSFFSGEKAKYNVTDFLNVSVYCMPKGVLVGKRFIKQSDPDVCCDGGAIHVVINPRFGVPPNIRSPLDNSGESFFGGGWGKIPDLFKPADGWTTPNDLWGDPVKVGAEMAGPGGVFAYPIYEFKNAQFNVGRFVDIQTSGSGAWEPALVPHTEMFRTWYTYSNSPNYQEINGIVAKVQSGDKLFIQVGCKGESKLAWKQVLRIK